MHRFLLTARVVGLVALMPLAVQGAMHGTSNGIAVRPRLLIPRITASSGPEGNSGFTTLTLTYSLPDFANQDVSGDYQTVDGTATAADNDYVPAQGKWSIPIGQLTSSPITIQIVGDTKVEADETFSIVASNVQNANTPAPVVVTILNDDVPVMTVNNPSVTEGNAGTVSLNFVVTLVPAAQIPVQATYQTGGGTATAGVDYQPAQGTLNFAPGETTKTVTVLVNGDSAVEPDETLQLTVNPSGGVAVTGTGTIINDDTSQPQVTIVSGNGQQGLLGRPLAQPLIVQVLDDTGKPLSGRTVQWTVTRGEALFNPASGPTALDGRASTIVTLNSVGSIQVQAALAQLPPVTFTLASVTSFGDRAKGPVAVPVAKALDKICARNDVIFAEACRSLSRLSDEQLTPTLERVAPQPSGAQSKAAGEVLSAVTSGIAARLAAVRNGERFSIQRLSLDRGGASIPIGSMASAALPVQQGGGGGTGESDYNGWSAFLSGNIGTGERIARLGQLGFDLKTHGVMFGVDRLVGGNNVVGVSLNWMNLDSKLDDAAGSLGTKGYALSVYASRSGLFAGNAPPSAGTGTHYDGVHLDGSLTAGRNSYDAEHVVDITGMPLSTATSRNHANVYALAGGTGLEGHHGRTDFDLSLSGTWSRANIDDLTESGSGPLILFVQGHDIESLVGTLGFNVRSALPVPFGTLLPSFRVEMVHEFRNGARLVTARFVRDTLGTSFTVPIDRPDPNYGRLGAGLQAELPRGYSILLEGTQDILRADLHFRTLQLNVRKAF